MHLLLLLALYFLPAIVAHARHSVSSTAITILNLLFGWTGIGWIVMLFWALLGRSWDSLCYRHPQAMVRSPARW
ncbi:MAG TPA: superinfection immunity protein [Acidisarcina sp.]